MRDNRPYNAREYQAFKAWLAGNLVLCWVDGCYRRATIPDHQPPLASFPDPTFWHGELKPICAYHSCRQRGQARHGRFLMASTRQW